LNQHSLNRYENQLRVVNSVKEYFTTHE